MLHLRSTIEGQVKTKQYPTPTRLIIVWPCKFKWTNLDKSRQNICTQQHLMCFVNDKHIIPSKIWFHQKLLEQHPVHHVFQHCFVAGTILEQNWPTLYPTFGAHLLSDMHSDWHGSNRTWLYIPHFQTTSSESSLVKILRELSCLSWSGLRNDCQNLMLSDSFDSLLFECIYGQEFLGFFYHFGYETVRKKCRHIR